MTKKKSSAPVRKKTSNKKTTTPRKTTRTVNAKAATTKKRASTKKTPAKKTTTKKAAPKKATTKKTAAKKPATRRRTVKKQPEPEVKPRNPLQKYLVFGVMLVFITAILVLSLLSPNQGSITPVLAGWIKQMFGIGRAIVPLAIGAFGVYCILIGIENRPQLPVRRLLGAGLLFAVVEAIASLWVFMRSLPDFWLLAGQGRGGGYFGSALATVVYSLVGDLGGIIIYSLLGVVAVFLLFALSPVQVGLTFRRLFGTAEQADDGIPPNPAPLSSNEHEKPKFSIFGFGRGKREAAVPDAVVLERDPDTMREVLLEEEQRVEAIRRRRRSQRVTAVEPERVVPEKTAAPMPTPRIKGRQKAAAQPIIPKPEPAQVTAVNQWAMPEVDTILESGYDPETNDDLIREQAAVIQETLASFGAPGNIVEVQRGPTVTQFGVEPGYILQRSGKRQKIKVSKIAGLADDLALALAAKSVRIQAPVPGKGFIGIEVPSMSKVVVSLRDVMESEGFHRISSPLRIGLGQDVAGNAISADLAKMPHLLVAGATGSGKSVCVNAIIACLLLQNSPNDLRFVMVDPKRVELTGYNSIPHMAAPVVVDMDKVIGVLMWALREMDSRYQAFAKAGARNIITYNKKMENAGGEKLPYIVIVIDELADLMMTAPEDTERALARLAQMARATGMHMIIATQRPSVDVVTGLIKANFPARIAFAVSSSTDSRVILDQTGAERLLGQGDMLIQKPDAPAPIRMQGCYVSDDELNKLIGYWKTARRFNTYTDADAEKKGVEIESGDRDREKEPIVTVRPIAVERVIAEEREQVDKKIDEQVNFDEFAPAPVKLEIEKPTQEPPPLPTLNSRPTLPEPKIEPEIAPKIEKVTDDLFPLPERIPAKPVQPLLDIEAENKKEVDELWDDAVAFVQRTGKASTSMLQRKFRIGYTRAARMIDEMEDNGIIGPPTGTSKAREVIGRDE